VEDYTYVSKVYSLFNFEEGVGEGGHGILFKDIAKLSILLG